MPTLTCEISDSLMQALLARGVRTGEPLDHVVMSALADALEVEHATLFQVSTSQALVEGVFDGVVRVSELKAHGDFGLGTFDGLDGELVAFDGEFFQVRASGEVSRPANDARVPFAVVTTFREDERIVLDPFQSAVELLAQLDRMRRTQNLFYAVRLDGHFEHLRTRAACKASSGTPLKEMHQSVFDFAAIDGTLVGFWTPTYARSLNVPGWHLHFLSDDRTHGGHLLDCRATNIPARIQHLADVRIAIPETAAFLHSDLTRDSSDELLAAEWVDR